MKPLPALRAFLGRAASFGPASLLLAGFAQAQEFQVTIDPTLTSSTVLGTYLVDLDTTVIGDFDAASNPGGTRTVPGFTGGGGNNSIPFDMGLSGTLFRTGPASGSFDLTVDRLGGALECANLDMDLLGGMALSSDLTVDLFYQTFRTFVPNSLFIGGIPVSIPLGAQTIETLQAVQSGPALGTLNPLALLGVYDFQLAVPVDFTMTVDFNGSLNTVGPFTGVVPLVGTVTVTGDQIDVNMVLQQVIQQVTVDPVPGFALMDVPFPLPTILPAGNTANLLLNGTIASTDVDLTLDLALTASGSAECGFSTYCPVPPNSTGMEGMLALTGSADVTQGDLTLTATQLPTGVFGIFVMSPEQDRIPLAPPSQGILCMGAPFYRFSQNILNSGPTGQVTLPLDFQNLPSGQPFAPGSTWNFQFWHRDMNPNNTANLTRGVTVTFCQ